MKIAYALYELEAKASLNAKTADSTRQGALLKISFDPYLKGYADCHPWPEIGDLPLEQQLSNLADGNLTPLTYSALNFAKLDAQARLRGVSILENQLLPCSHFLITSCLEWTIPEVQKIIQQGFTHVKIKVGRQLDAEIKCLINLFLHTSLKLRLDFNEVLTFESFQEYLGQLHSLKKSIDFIEDPFPFHSQQWAYIQENGWNLACDRQAEKALFLPECAKILMIKSAIQPFMPSLMETSQLCIVTSYMSHPLEQLTAAYMAAWIDPLGKRVHGLLSHHAYFPNSFSRYLNWIGSKFTLPPGQGFGFDEELKSLKWISLR